MLEYIVKKVKQPSGMMFAVVHGNRYMFLQKESKEAVKIANRMNAIQERRLKEIV